MIKIICQRMVYVLYTYYLSSDILCRIMVKERVFYYYLCCQFGGGMEIDMKYEYEIKKALADVMEMNPAEIKIDENTMLIGGLEINSLGISSMDFVEFLVRIEEIFGIVFDFKVRINTIGELISYIDSNV